jgi:Peptidase S46
MQLPSGIFSMIKFRFKIFFCLTLLFLCAVPSIADEGLWTFNNPPRKQLKEKCGFDAGLKWLEHVQKSSVRFNSSGSGSFISASGLTLTNHM